MDWQPIETAPRDGTSVLLYVRGKQCVGRWFLEMWHDWGVQAPFSDAFSPVGEIIIGSVIVRSGPTHWMSLPPPPA